MTYLIYLLSGLLVFHGIVCLLGAFFPFYPPVFLFYWFFPGHFAIRLIIVLIIGAAQLAYGVYLALGKRWKIRWYWPTLTVVVLVGLLLISPAVQNPGLFTGLGGKDKNRQPIPVKDMLPMQGEEEAPDDIMPTPGGPGYRANFHQQGVENPWPPIESREVVLAGNVYSPGVTYRDYIETAAGEPRNNILHINTDGREIHKLNLYTIDSPAGIEVTEGMRWHGPGPVAVVLVIEVSQDIAPGQYTFEIGVEINGTDCGAVPCTIEVIDSTTQGEIHTPVPVKDSGVPQVNQEAPDALAPVPAMGPMYRANVHQTGVENPWPPIEISEAYLGSGSDTVSVLFREYIKTAAGETRNNIIMATIAGKDIKSMSLYADNVPAGIKLTVRWEQGGPLTSSRRTLLLAIGISPNVAPGQYPLEIGLVINGKDYGTVPCTIEVIDSTVPNNGGITDITIQPEPGQYLVYDNQESAGVILKSVTIKSDVCERDYMDLRGDATVRTGEPCLLVTGQVESQLGQDGYMTLSAKGYDVNGEEVTYVLDAGPIWGVISIFVPSKGAAEFVLHLKAAPDVVRIELLPSPELYDIPPP